MRHTIIIATGLLIAVTASAGERLRTVDFDGDGVRLVPGHVAESDGGLTVSSPSSPALVAVLGIAEPGITAETYALAGQVRHSGIDGVGYLQLDSHFAGRGTFFTKSLAEHGAMRSLRGESQYRPFLLPFTTSTGDAHAMRPDELTLRVFLPGSGSVTVKDLEIYQYAAGENPLTDADASSAGAVRASALAGIIGGVGGSLLGLWGALIGTLAGMGKARGFVLGSLRAAGFVGGLLAMAGIAAWYRDGASAVVYALLLLGGMLLLTSTLGSSVRQRYEAMELRRMSSLDAG